MLLKLFEFYFIRLFLYGLIILKCKSDDKQHSFNLLVSHTKQGTPKTQIVPVSSDNSSERPRNQGKSNGGKKINRTVNRTINGIKSL